MIILDTNTRSGQIDLINGSDDPMEFTVIPMLENAGIVNSAAPVLRWAPERSVAPAHRSQGFRVAARPTPELAPGEYAYRFQVRAQIQRKTPDILVETDETTQQSVISGFVPVVPLLPVTVYLRYKIEAPRVDVLPLTLTPDDPDSLGYFIAVKRYPDRSFVGTIKVVNADTGVELSSGRLHLGQEGPEARVTMPRGIWPTGKNANFCLKVWAQFPAQGEPYANSCSGS
ncbi:hypothetical protein [Sphingorhabdus sp.]|uniref:hypothetical protein n=1 Tax=Sphingorhabdus sp. TaxID=1902408 RepID=UPI00333F8818